MSALGQKQTFRDGLRALGITEFAKHYPIRDTWLVRLQRQTKLMYTGRV